MFFSNKKLTMVKEATVEFTMSNITAHWSESDGYLLDFAESLGIDALSSCRNGHCGACLVELTTGQVIHEKDISVECQGNQILLCSAKPASALVKIKI